MKSTTGENGKEYRDCVVANIIGPHYWGQEKIIRHGTKHFRAGAKVYCVFMYGGMGHEQIRVMGKPRRQRRLIEVVVSARYLKNFRVGRTYHSKVMAFLSKHDDRHAPEQWLEWLGEDLNNGHCEIELPPKTDE